MKLNQAQATNPIHSIELPEPTEAEIQKEAYYLWIESGRPAGRDLEFWHAAQELLRHRHGRSPAFAVVHLPPGPR